MALPLAVPEWVALAHRVEAKLLGIAGDVDTQCMEALRREWPLLAGLEGASLQTPAHRTALLRLLSARWRELPALESFAHPGGQLVLLPRAAIVSNLCMLALARRPGVLRCCIDKSARLALQQALGERLAALVAIGASGRPVSTHAAEWGPQRWACVGYVDWRDGLASADAGLHGIAALSLPPALLAEVLASPHEAGDFDADEALARLAQAGAAWPC